MACGQILTHFDDRGASLYFGSVNAPQPLVSSWSTARPARSWPPAALSSCEKFLGDSRSEWYIADVTFTIDIEREDDGRWLAEVPALPGVMAYGQDRDEAIARVQALALRVIAERLEHREAPAEFLNVTFQAA